MCYCVGRVIIHKNKFPELHERFGEFAHLSNNLYNASLFRIRQHFTAYKKDQLEANEAMVEKEINETVSMYDSRRPSSVISYFFLERMMRANHNPDFFSGLPMHTAQHALKDAVQNMKSWLSALRSYKKNPDAFTGRPRMPGYSKSGSVRTFTMSNQECVICHTDGKTFLKIPKTKERVQIEQLPEDVSLKEVKVKPYYDDFELLYAYECEDAPRNNDLKFMAAIDFGVTNAAAIVTNEGNSLLVKGGALKAANQWFNKQKAFYTSELTKGHKTTEKASSKMLSSLSANRKQFLLDAYHQISKRIIAFCLERKVGTIVLGKSAGWKQNVNIGHVNNQSFTSLPIDMLRNMIVYKAERAGIRTIEQEESYTSKASFLDNDFIATYGVDDEIFSPSGRRIKRGLYRSSDGTVINADINAAANILRKAEQTAFDGVNDFSFLQKPEVMYFTDLHKSTPLKGIAFTDLHKSTPLKGIAAA